MTSKRIFYYILAAFTVGNLVLIYIQYNSANNINSLIRGNEQLLAEFEVSNNLKDLERDIISIESKIRGTVTTSDSSHIEGLDQKIAAVDAELSKLNKISDDDSSVQYINILDQLVHQKLYHSRQILDSLNLSGKNAAEKVIALQKGKHLTDSIILVTARIHDLRGKLLAVVIANTDKSGKNALRFGTILIALVLISAAAVFYTIINTIRKQNQLIEQLHYSQQKEREAAKIKENFLANMSHEIRTPMNAIIGFTNLLQHKKLEPEAASYVDRIHRSGESLLTIIDDILDLSKIEAGMMRIEAAPFSLREILYSIEALFKVKLEAKHLQWHIKVDDDMPDTLIGDATRLTQILVNLVANALKFTEQGFITVTVSNIGIHQNRVSTAIEVSDTGIGIAPEKLASIFDRFQQAEESVTRNYGGTGLGLSIVKELVQLQNGSIEVQSKPGQGTSFRVVLPYLVGVEQPTAANKILAVTEDATPAFVHGCILVVEDNEINQSLVRHLFAKWNIDFDIAFNGEEAIALLKEKEYSLVLMDIQMPVMDGYTAATIIRQQMNLQIPIVAMTAHAFAGEKEKCMSYGMNDYISKPIREADLQQLIRDYGAGKNSPGKSTVQQRWPTMQGPCIDLAYMREISGGNKEYEKTVTAQFIEMIPDELKALQTAWQQGDISGMRKRAHNMKTTTSIMGLTEKLQPLLDSLEYDMLDERGFSECYAALEQCCLQSVKEAQQFLASL